MDYRMKSFKAEATSVFAFLTDLGFVRSTSHPRDHSRRPFTLTVSFRHPDARVETSLVLEFGGDDSVDTTVSTLNGDHRLQPRVARKGHEMRKALGEHAEEVRRLIGSNA